MEGFTPLLWREIKVGLTPLSVLRRFLAPTLYVVVFAIAFTANIGYMEFSGVKVNYMLFLIPGVIAVASFESFSLAFALVRLDIVSRMLDVIIASRAGMRSYVAAKMAFFQIAAIITALYIIGLGYALTRWVPSLPGILLLLLGLILNTTLWFSVGFILGCKVHSEDIRDITLMLLSFPILFASPVFYNIDVAPMWIKILSYFNPLTYAVNIMRAGYLGIYPSTLPVDMIVLATCVLVALIACFTVAKKIAIK